MKQVALVIMLWIVLYFFGTMCLAFVRDFQEVTETRSDCDWKLQMTCWEYGCEDLCYPFSINWD